MYTLGTAAKATGVAKSTIHRAIKSGRISVRSSDSNSYEIDPAELHRVFPPVSLERPVEPTIERDATSDSDLDRKLAVALFEVTALRELLEVERRRAEELRVERDRWHGAHEQQSQRLIADQSGRKRWRLFG